MTKMRKTVAQLKVNPSSYLDVPRSATKNPLGIADLHTKICGVVTNTTKTSNHYTGMYMEQLVDLLFRPLAKSQAT
jgi:hypothetical protein